MTERRPWEWSVSIVFFVSAKVKLFPALISFESTQKGQAKLQAEVKSKLMETGPKIGNPLSGVSPSHPLCHRI
jgi:hypothetical protein